MTESRFVSSIREHNTGLVKIWMEAVRADDRIKSDKDLSDGGLVDHIPVMLEEICEHLERDQPPSSFSIREARVHVYLRYQNGYRGRDLVGELSQLRTLLHDHLTELARKSADVTFEDFSKGLRLINQYIDEEVRFAIAVYSEQPQKSEA